MSTTSQPLFHTKTIVTRYRNKIKRYGILINEINTLEVKKMKQKLKSASGEVLNPWMKRAWEWRQ